MMHRFLAQARLVSKAIRATTKALASKPLPLAATVATTAAVIASKHNSANVSIKSKSHQPLAVARIDHSNNEVLLEAKFAKNDFFERIAQNASSSKTMVAKSKDKLPPHFELSTSFFDPTFKSIGIKTKRLIASWIKNIIYKLEKMNDIQLDSLLAECYSLEKKPNYKLFMKIMNELKIKGIVIEKPLVDEFLIQWKEIHKRHDDKVETIPLRIKELTTDLLAAANPLDVQTPAVIAQHSLSS